jgi:ribosome-binding ATPase YchF (GTP1/OBG family)
VQIAIVGLARSGKTTVFNTLTRGTAETGGFGGMTVNVGVVKVPDERLTKLTELFKPKKEIAADVTYVDLPAPPTSADGIEPAEIPADQLARLRTADELLHVVRAFDDPSVPHPDGSVDPWRDIERLDLEFVLADLSQVDKRIEKLRQQGHHGSAQEREANDRELAVLEKLAPALREGNPIRDI